MCRRDRAVQINNGIPVAHTQKSLVPHLLCINSFALVIVYSSPCPTLAQSGAGWPFIRGPNYDGHSSETGLADSWPVEGPPVLWTRELGQGYSSFIAWDRRVATQIQTLAGQYVVCLDADTGDTIWQYRYEWPYEPAGLYPGPRATPTYADGFVYFSAPSGLIGCLTASEGRLIWSVNVNKKFDGKGTGFGYSCSPTVVDGKVVLPVGGNDASMVALDTKDGSVVWKEGDDPASYTPAYPITFGDRRFVLGYLQNSFVSHDLKTGERVFRRNLSSGYDEHAAWPIYEEPKIWLSAPFQAGSQLLKLNDDPQQPLSTVWQSRLLSNDIFSSVLVDGALYGFDLREPQAKAHRPSRGQFRCLDFDTGEQLWVTGDPKTRRSSFELSEEEIRVPWIGHASVIVADGKLILMNDLGELILARVNREKYEQLGRVLVLGGELCWTQPSLHRKRLYIRNQSRAACLYLGEAQHLKAEVATATLSVADIPQSSYTDLTATILGVEPEYAFDLPSMQWLKSWFLFSSIAILGTSIAVAFVVRILFMGRLGASGTRWVFWTAAFVLGSLGTTFLSRWRGDFVFTWPVAIFVAFQAATYQLRTKKLQSSTESRIWRRVWPRLIGLAFLATCGAYFLICRRFSLVFEWVFLCGFLGAVPFALAGALLFRERRWSFLWEIAMTFAAFSAFFWSAVWVLLSKAG